MTSRKLFCICFALLVFAPVINAQPKKKRNKEISFPMSDKHWEYDEGSVEFFENRGVQAVRGKDGGYFVLKLKDFIFTNGTIEYDVELAGTGFPGINFRMTDGLLEGENFYIRSFGPVSPLSRTTLQYASIIDSTTTWDLTDEYQAGAKITQQGWNHVKLVVHGKQMKVYVNDMEKPALHVPVLESKSDKGQILLTGNVIYSNFKITPDATEDLPAEAGYDPTTTDTRYIRNWMVSNPIDFDYGKDLVLQIPTMYDEIKNSDLPDGNTAWKPVKVEHRGLVNLSREYGLKREGGRRLVWLKTNISSDNQQIRNLKLGFNDEVWVFLNGNLLYMDKNYFGTPGQKYPKGRVSLENTSFDLPLQEGDNELLIGVGHFFFGWGIMARLDETNGLTLD